MNAKKIEERIGGGRVGEERGGGNKNASRLKAQNSNCIKSKYSVKYNVNKPAY